MLQQVREAVALLQHAEQLAEANYNSGVQLETSEVAYLLQIELKRLQRCVQELQRFARVLRTVGLQRKPSLGPTLSQGGDSLSTSRSITNKSSVVGDRSDSDQSAQTNRLQTQGNTHRSLTDSTASTARSDSPHIGLSIPGEISGRRSTIMTVSLPPTAEVPVTGRQDSLDNTTSINNRVDDSASVAAPGFDLLAPGLERKPQADAEASALEGRLSCKPILPSLPLQHMTASGKLRASTGPEADGVAFIPASSSTFANTNKVTPQLEYRRQQQQGYENGASHPSSPTSSSGGVSPLGAGPPVTQDTIIDRKGRASLILQRMSFMLLSQGQKGTVAPAQQQPQPSASAIPKPPQARTNERLSNPERAKRTVSKVSDEETALKAAMAGKAISGAVSSREPSTFVNHNAATNRAQNLRMMKCKLVPITREYDLRHESHTTLLHKALGNRLAERYFAAHLKYANFFFVFSSLTCLMIPTCGIYLYLLDGDTATKTGISVAMLLATTFTLLPNIFQSNYRIVLLLFATFDFWFMLVEVLLAGLALVYLNQWKTFGVLSLLSHFFAFLASLCYDASPSGAQTGLRLGVLLALAYLIVLMYAFATRAVVDMDLSAVISFTIPANLNWSGESRKVSVSMLQFVTNRMMTIVILFLRMVYATFKNQNSTVVLRSRLKRLEYYSRD